MTLVTQQKQLHANCFRTNVPYIPPFKRIVSNLNASPGGELSPEKDVVRVAVEAGKAPDTKTPRRVFKVFGWLELFIGSLIILVPLSYLIHLGKLSEIPKEIPDLKYLGSAGFWGRGAEV